MRAGTEINTKARHVGQEEMGDSSLARLKRVEQQGEIVAKVFRFDPTTDAAPRYQTYVVPYTKWMRVLDVLNYISEDLEEDLAYRWYCGVKKCGTCAVRVNGREVLACWESAEPEMVIEPLRHAPILRDLVIDRAPYENRLYELMPWLQRADAYTGFPERVPHREMKKAAGALDCLSCMACYSACPVLELGDETNFAGPAPLVQLAQTALDPRDNGEDRGRLVLDKAAIFSCVSCYRCEEVCPAGIKIVTQVIEPLKAKAYEADPARCRHSSSFLDLIEQRGRIDPSALVLRIQGLAALRRLGRVFKLLIRGKIDPLKTFFGSASEGIEQVRKIYRRLGDKI